MNSDSERITPAAEPMPGLKFVHRTEHGYWLRYKHLTFMVTQLVENDGKVWRHASVSRNDCSMPTWEDLAELKRVTIGPQFTAYQVFPPKDEYFHGKQYRKEVLHLWCCMDGPVTPDFRKPGFDGKMEI